jgi:hypothetical protein
MASSKSGLRATVPTGLNSCRWRAGPARAFALPHRSSLITKKRKQEERKQEERRNVSHSPSPMAESRAPKPLKESPNGSWNCRGCILLQLRIRARISHEGPSGAGFLACVPDATTMRMNNFGNRPRSSAEMHPIAGGPTLPAGNSARGLT